MNTTSRTRLDIAQNPEAIAYIRDRIRISDAGCWEWTLVPQARGYGAANWRGGSYRAHRFSYEAHVGAIAEGLVIDHLCRNHGCVNPDHLEPVTQEVNLKRGQSPMALAVQTGRCAKGHALEGDNLWVSPEGERQCKTCNRDRRRANYQLRLQAGPRCSVNDCDAMMKSKGMCQRHYRQARKVAA